MELETWKTLERLSDWKANSTEIMDQLSSGWSKAQQFDMKLEAQVVIEVKINLN